MIIRSNNIEIGNCFFSSCGVSRISHPVDGRVFPPKNVGNFSDNSLIASSMAMASPAYDSEPASGNEPVATGALAITKRISTVLVRPFGNV